MDLDVEFAMEDSSYIEDLFMKSEEQLQAEIQEIIEEYADLMVEMAKSLCPVKTGFLQDSIYAEMAEDGVNILAWAPYWGFQEFGTKYIVGKYFLTQAVETYEEAMYAEIDCVVAEYFEGI